MTMDILFQVLFQILFQILFSFLFNYPGAAIRWILFRRRTYKEYVWGNDSDYNVFTMYLILGLVIFTYNILSD